MTTWHIITPEYPPQPGGVSDYTSMVGNALAQAGDEIHVWCPTFTGETPAASGVTVHREFGDFSRSDLARVDKLLDRFTSPRRLLVQWVPHGYGQRAMNLAFCWWLWRRARQHRDRVELMVHEPFLEFTGRSAKQNAVALVQRLMTMILLRTAKRVWISIPAWETYWRPYTFGGQLEFRWLPVASNIQVIDDPEAIKLVRSRYVADDGLVVGHFGAYDRLNTNLMIAAVSALIGAGSKNILLLLGRGSDAMRDALIEAHPEMADDVYATGALDAAHLSLHLGACDVMLQPYVDGVSSRRSSIMAALAHGVPVVTTSGPFTEELWAESGAVQLVPVNEVKELREETKRLLADVSARNHLAGEAQALYSARFDIEVTVKTLRDAAATVEHASE